MPLALNLPPLPPAHKPVAHFLKTASEHESRDPVVAYWCRLAALQEAMQIDKKSTEAKAVLITLMEWLEKEKKVLISNEAITSEIVASAHIENYAIKLFDWADKEDRNSNFGKNVVKAFYTAGNLFEVMKVFGEPTPEVVQRKKYAKWKAAYIHNCLKNGEQPIPGPMGGEDDEEQQVVNQDEFGAGGWQQPPENSAPPVPQPRSHPQPAPPSFSEPVPEAAPAAAAQTSSLQPEEVMKVQKLCKYASSAMDYNDVDTAVKNLTEALAMLQRGK